MNNSFYFVKFLFLWVLHETHGPNEEPVDGCNVDAMVSGQKMRLSRIYPFAIRSISK